MRVLLPAYRSRGGVEQVVGLALRLQALGAEVRVCAPQEEELAERQAGVGLPVHPIAHGSRFRPAADVPRRSARLIVEKFDTVAAATERCDALVATGAMLEGVWL